MSVFLGNSASSGIGIGTAFVIPEEQKRIIPIKTVSDEEKDSEWERFTESLKKVTDSILQKIEETKEDKIQSEIFGTYFLMLNDPEFIQTIQKSFEENNRNIESILNEQTDLYAGKLRTSGNSYLAERAQDVCDVFGQVLDDLLGFKTFNIDSVPDGSIIVAAQMNPSDTIILSKRHIQGLALTEGGVTSHVGILARNYGVPAVFALENITSNVKTGEIIIVDANKGEVIVSPDETTLKAYQVKLKFEKEYFSSLKKFRKLPAITKDGVRFKIMANIGTVEEAKKAIEEGADGIGLFRTEFLFMSENSNSDPAQSSILNEEVQFDAYKAVLQTMGKRPVTIRTLDMGGDKLINSAEIEIKEEKNPLMGLRAIRISLAHPQQLKIQFRALYRASVYGNLKIMLPLITDVDQVVSALKIAEEARSELKEENKRFNANVPIGVMIETPAAALIADCLAQKSAFFSIGTNDLTQYTLCVDREDTEVAPLYDEFHLAVLRLIDRTVQIGKKEKIPVSVCGEMASRKTSALVLAGMGVRNLSMSPNQICIIKELLSRYTIKELSNISSKRLNSL